MLKYGLRRTLPVFVIFCFFWVFSIQDDAFGRVGGGRTSGSRGSRPVAPSRSYSPQKPAQPPSGAQEAAPIPQQQPRGGGFLRGLGGGILGGILGGMLFRGLGFGGDGTSGGGIGLFEILLFAALVYFAYLWFVKRRRAAAAEGYYQQSVQTGEPIYQTPSPPTYGPQYETEDLQKGVGHIRDMDASFDQNKFKDVSTDLFFKIQGAWTNREISGVKDLFTEEMFKVIGDDVHRLKLDRKINKLENIAVRSVEVVEAWQESGNDFVTVKFHANLLDYTVDESTAQVLSGSNTEPVKFEELWTFARPVGNHPWRLSAIEQLR